MLLLLSLLLTTYKFGAWDKRDEFMVRKKCTSNLEGVVIKGKDQGKKE